MTGQGYSFGGERAQLIKRRIRERTTLSGGGATLSAKDERDMDRLADQIAEGRAMHLAATRLGMSIFRAEFLWQRIISRLGRQALD